MVTVSHTVLQ